VRFLNICPSQSEFLDVIVEVKHSSHKEFETMELQTEYDVVVIGGSSAGSTIATTLKNQRYLLRQFLMN
jgi:ribulose 1,5-bisphosphate synthetase/thiazole synthase